MRTRYRFLTFSILPCLAFFHIFLRDVGGQIPTVLIASVSFEGNQSISTNQLRQQIGSSSEGNRYASEILGADLQRVERLYQDEGFLDARIGPPDVRIQKSAAGEAAHIRIPITEGRRYAAGKVSVRNAEVFDPQTLLQMSPLQKGQPYRRSLLIQWQSKIEEAYRSLGHLRAACRTQESLNAGNKTVDCVLDCVAGKVYSVGKITIAGDASIDRSRFLRRLLLSEGGIFNYDNLVLSIQFLNQMRLFNPIAFSDVELSIDDARSTVDLTFHLSPVKQ